MQNKLITNRKAYDAFFSIVVYIDRLDGVERLLTTAFGFNHDTWKTKQVILIDTECSVDSIYYLNELAETYENYVEVCYAKGMSISEAYNNAMQYVRGYYVNFTLSSSYFNKDTLEHVYACAWTDKLPTLISMAPWTTDENGIFAQYTQSPRIYDGKRKIIDLTKEPGVLSLCLHAYFIRCDLVHESGVWFKELGYESTGEYLLRMLEIAKKYLYISYAFYNYTVPMEDNKSAFLGQYNIDWYTKALHDTYMPVFDKYAKTSQKLPEFIQKIAIWSLYVRFNCNYNDANKGVLAGEELQKFYDEVGKILSYLSDDFVWKKNKGQSYAIPRTIKLLMLRIKANYIDKKSSIVVKNDCLYGNFGEKDIKLCELKNEHVIIDDINFDKGKVSIDGRCSLGDFSIKEKLKLYINVNGKRYPLQNTEIYLPNKVFGETYQNKFRFYGEFYSYGDSEKTDVFFEVEIEKEIRKLKIKIGSIYARVSRAKQECYWNFSENGIMYLNEDVLCIQNVTRDQLNAKEEALQKVLRSGNEAEQYAANVRKTYFELLQEKERPIWISFDKLYKAGDSGEYIFEYINSKDSKVDMYYIIKEDAPDCERLVSKYGDKILIWGEERTLYKVLLSDVILATHTSITSNLGISSELSPFVSDLFTPINVCIQHGLTVQNIAQYQNRVFDNTEFYVCASQNEVDNILQPIYGYSKDMVKLTGLARYDGLKNKAKKQILITPTWRRNIANSNTAHFKKAHNEFFKHSEYFRIYNSLINNEKLISYAEKHGYKIIYLIHPAVSSQIDDFDKNPYVDIIPAAGDMNYEKILTESALMVTDYSGVQFDFAYMKKPVLYYHPASLPPHYDESKAYQYDRDAFGPIITDGDELVNQLCKYMENDCCMKNEYKNRVNKFFAYDDFNSCKRIVEAVSEYVDKRKGVV